MTEPNQLPAEVLERHGEAPNPRLKEVMTATASTARAITSYDDAVFGVRESLIVDFTPDKSGELSAALDFVLDKRSTELGRRSRPAPVHAGRT